MDNFPEMVRSLAKRVQRVKDSIQTEEATKTSAIMPFFQILNYDVFNPEEFVPEFIADVGIKKGEKVDYAIVKDGNPVILIEAKSIHEQLDKHSSQLFRYFGTSKAKFAILTNGSHYQFYTDLEHQNMMDSVPFFEFNLHEIRDNQIAELMKFRKDQFDIDNILNTATELKYTNEIKQAISKQFESPSDEFVSILISEVYSGKKTKQVLEKFNGLVKRSFKQLINDLLNDKLKAALENTNEPEKEVAATTEAQSSEQEASPPIITTEEEIEGYATVKLMLSDIIESDRIFYRDNLSYFNVLIDDNIRKWICRLGFNSANKYIQFNDEQKTSVIISKPSDIVNFKKQLESIAEKFK